MTTPHILIKVEATPKQTAEIADALLDLLGDDVDMMVQLTFQLTEAQAHRYLRHRSDGVLWAYTEEGE
jgi:hypothetical protein